MRLYFVIWESCFLGGNYRDLCEYLNSTNTVLAKHGLHLLDNVLETLDMQQHSLGVLAVLAAKYTMTLAAAAQDNRFNQAKDFILNCNGEQIRLAPEMCK